MPDVTYPKYTFAGVPAETEDGSRGDYGADEGRLRVGEQVIVWGSVTDTAGVEWVQLERLVPQAVLDAQGEPRKVVVKAATNLPRDQFDTMFEPAGTAAHDDWYAPVDTTPEEYTLGDDLAEVNS